MVARAFKQKGKSYVKWAAKLAVELETGVPWVMCKQDESHDPLVGFICLSFSVLFLFLVPYLCYLIVSVMHQINACNGRQCGETIPSFSETTIRSEYLLEHMNTTQDTSDYLWQIFR